MNRIEIKYTYFAHGRIAYEVCRIERQIIAIGVLNDWCRIEAWKLFTNRHSIEQTYKRR